MTPEQFAYWLQGYAELNPNTPPNLDQWRQIQDHLNTVFTKVTPNRLTPSPFTPVTVPYVSPSPLTPYTVPTWTKPEVTC